MLPKEYKFFCKLNNIEKCSRLGSLDCPETCNLAEDYILQDEIDSEYDSISYRLNNIKKNEK